MSVKRILTETGKYKNGYASDQLNIQPGDIAQKDVSRNTAQPSYEANDYGNGICV